MHVSAYAISLVIDPTTLINIPINMDKLALPMSPIILPLTLIACAIWPHLQAKAVPEAANPLASVGSPSLEGIHWSFLPLCLWIVLLILRDCLL